ncbi:MAG: pyridoxamine 5'-phosphate oxidase family protein [Deltaproteobacteria bacterium]|nr:pyridoxamine 5'-phosphate oxidase family protein [Deltaproteobacteria bacterium]
MLDRMKALAASKDICVLATVSGGRPHCSLMAYVTDNECREVYMATRKDTAKYRNLMENPFVSILIDTREEHAGARRPEASALTVTGRFERLEEEGKRGVVRERLLAGHPHLREFLSHPEAEPICIRISSFLLLDGLTDAHFEEIE